MTTIYVSYTDSTESTIQTVFSGPQDPTYWPYQGTVTTSDSRYATYYATQPDFAKEFLPEPTT